MRQFILCLIVLCSSLLTASGQQADSIKFAPGETRAVVSAWVNQPKYQRLIDSCEIQIKELQAVIKSDSVQIKSCEDVKDSQGLLVAEHKRRKDELEGDLKKANLWRRFWKTATGVVSAGSAGYIIYKDVRN